MANIQHAVKKNDRLFTFCITKFLCLFPDEKILFCEKCQKETKHKRVQFNRNPHRWYINDSPYGDKVRG